MGGLFTHSRRNRIDEISLQNASLSDDVGVAVLINDEFPDSMSGRYFKIKSAGGWIGWGNLAYKAERECLRNIFTTGVTPV